MFWHRVLINLNGIKETWIAQQIGVSSSTFSTWKAKDRIPRADEAVGIAKILGVSVEYLVTGEDGIPDDVRGMVSDLRKLPEEIRESVAVQIRALVEMRQVKESKRG